ncbi:hypothetical protein F0562_011518 [Nyssa sinensis]|uniref:Uncharacterized protein n=1 Tax=Nyssa sinensis TaxID=561372 RepID=A0A5J4ZQ72_9ASTE|nr:hypothetical protein F0562_011518 [Nyssa sinensis]
MHKGAFCDKPEGVGLMRICQVGIIVDPKLSHLVICCDLFSLFLNYAAFLKLSSAKWLLPLGALAAAAQFQSSSIQFQKRKLDNPFAQPYTPYLAAAVIQADHLRQPKIGAKLVVGVPFSLAIICSETILRFFCCFHGA